MNPRWPFWALAVAVWSTPVGCQMSDGFYCGEPLPGNQQVVQACTAPNEVCVCATRSCAEKVDDKECTSGYRYVSVPFARQELAERCVDSDVSDGGILDQHQDDKKCPLSGEGGGGMGGGS